MPFELPADSPIQNLQSTAETIGLVVAAYAQTLQRQGLSDELVIRLTVQYAHQLTATIYTMQVAAGQAGGGPSITIRRKNPPPPEE